MNPRKVRFLVALDNREPWHKNHDEFYFEATEYETVVTYPREGNRTEVEVRYRLETDLDVFGMPDGPNPLFALDDGRTVRLFYVAGYANPGNNGEGMAACILIHPIHTQDWISPAFGPRRCYMLAMNREDRREVSA